MNRAAIFKVLIVLIVFPVFVHLFFTIVTVPVRPLMAPAFDAAGARADLLNKGFSVVALLLAARLSFAVCRRLWPNPTFRDLQAQAKRQGNDRPTFTIRSASR